MVGQADKKQKRSLGSSVLMVGLFVGVIGAAVWANLWKSELRVADIQVSGNLIVPDNEILSLASISKDQRLYSVDLQSAQRRVTKNAFVKSASVNREAPNRISITVHERVPIAAVVLDKIEYIDAEGVVLPPARPENVFDLPVLTGRFQASEFIPGKQIVRADVKEALGVLVTAQQLSDESYRRISEVHVESDRDMVLYTEEFGVPIVFGHDNVAAKLVKLDGFWNEFVLHHGAHELAYIDLRFEDQVVVRWNHDKDEVRTTKAAIEKSVKPTKS